MGIREKRKEMTIMKRLVIISVTVVFAASSLAAAPVSFAVSGTSGKTNSRAVTYSDENEGEEQQKNYTEKDTSWFDYRNPKDTYEISTEGELIGLASLVNENQVDKWKPTRIENFENVTFILKNDIELTAEWTPIGTGSASYFAGTFDGNGHTISGLDVNMDSGPAGLFGYLVGQVQDLTVEGKITSGDGNCGGIAGLLNSTGKITGCTSDVKISAKDKTGGIVGYNDGGTIELSMNLGNVSGTYKVGGIVGENWGGTVNECGNRGQISSSKRGVATYGTGGVAGRSVSAEAKVTRSFNSGKILSDTEATGGVVGYTNAGGATIKECYNTGEIRIKNKNNSQKISKSYAGGIVGIIGDTRVNVKNCYSSSAVLNADVSGGVAGHYINESSNSENLRYLANNYYSNGKFKTGIGAVYNEKDSNIAKAATGISDRSFTGLISSLTAAYKDDMGIYGNGGYPVLEWQEPVSDDEKIYLEGVSKDIQKTLDKYMMKNAETSHYGQSIINFFSPASYTTDAMLLYNENKGNLKDNNKDTKEEK